MTTGGNTTGRDLRLLRLLNERQAKGRTDELVMPDDAMAADAGLGFRDSEACAAALERLVAAELLEQADRIYEQFSTVVGQSDHGFACTCKITPRGMGLLGAAEPRSKGRHRAPVRSLL
jgi:hypothetical protein